MDDMWIVKRKKASNPLDDFDTGVGTNIDVTLPKSKRWADDIYDDF